MMEKSVSVADANRSFLRILREVRERQTYAMTSHGAPVARIVPAPRSKAALAAAKRRLIAHLRA
jgi:prevent-host-death family protein